MRLAAMVVGTKCVRNEVEHWSKAEPRTARKRKGGMLQIKKSKQKKKFHNSFLILQCRKKCVIIKTLFRT